MTLTINGIEGVKEQAGNHLGYSGWHEVTQEQVNTFADATGDHQWIHVDVERAKQGPFGGPIAHGYLTLSLGPLLIPQIVRVEGVALTVNYGLNRVRFPAPLPVGVRWRGGGAPSEVCEIAGGLQVKLRLTVEVERSEKPAVVADSLIRVYA